MNMRLTSAEQLVVMSASAAIVFSCLGVAHDLRHGRRPVAEALVILFSALAIFFTVLATRRRPSVPPAR